MIFTKIKHWKVATNSFYFGTMWHCTLHMCICLLFFSRSILSVKSTSSLSVECLMKNIDSGKLVLRHRHRHRHRYETCTTFSEFYFLTKKSIRRTGCTLNLCMFVLNKLLWKYTAESVVRKNKNILNHGNVTPFHFLSISLLFSSFSFFVFEVSAVLLDAHFVSIQ